MRNFSSVNRVNCLLIKLSKYMKIIYENCGVKNHMKEDHLSCRRNFCSWGKKAFCSCVYKTTKIVRALWLSWEYVNMIVESRCFAPRALNHASTNLKKFSSSKLDKFTLFTHSFVGWNLENRYKESVNFCSLKLTF